MVDELTLENLRWMAEQAGLRLSEAELLRLLPGVNRARKQAAELRDVLALSDEPAVIFGPYKMKEE